MINILILLVTCLFPIVALSSDHTSKFPLEKIYETYDITGNNFEEVYSSYENSAPDWLKNLGYEAFTMSKYYFDIDDNTCKLNEFFLKITYTLPKLIITSRNENISNEIIFNLTRLYQHEEVHCAISLEVLDKIYDAAKLGQGSSEKCISAAETIRKLEDYLVDAHKKFDIETGHGESPDRYILPNAYYLKRCRISIDPYMNQNILQ